MAKLYAFQGVIVRFAQTDEEDEQFGVPPEWDDMLEFDLNTNEHIRTSLFLDWNSHTLSGGVLRKDGQVVTVNDPGDEYLGQRQGEDIEERVRALLAGLVRIENPIDFGYAYKARLLAKANGENDATILSIVDRATAAAYVSGMSQFQALTVAQRQWLAVELESQAYDAMVIRLLLV